MSGPLEQPPAEPDIAVAPVPPEGTFWQRYNQNLELPTSVLISVLALSLGFMLIVFVIWAAMTGPDRTPVPIVLGEGGPDEFGMGSPSEGGTPEPITIGQSATQADLERMDLPKDQLPQVKDDLQKVINVEDPLADVSIPDSFAAAYATLDKELRDKMLGVGQKRGTPGAGTGDTGQGTGVGGTGNDSTRARSLRWVLRFRTTSGRDYLDQLMALKAVVMVPARGTNKEMYIFRDLANPRPGTVATDSDIAQVSRLIQFSDIRRESVDAVAAALGLDYDPKVFWAFFPAELEAELARLEKAYMNRQPEAIEETVFQVTVRGGRYTLVVVEQRTKR
jgi:hypothetical protein